LNEMKLRCRNTTGNKVMLRSQVVLEILCQRRRRTALHSVWHRACFRSSETKRCDSTSGSEKFRRYYAILADTVAVQATSHGEINGAKIDRSVSSEVAINRRRSSNGEVPAPPIFANTLPAGALH
jgi:hypothetical protein